MTNLERYQSQLDRLCRIYVERISRVRSPERPLTGIEKHNQEQREAELMWKELKDERIK